MCIIYEKNICFETIYNISPQRIPKKDINTSTESQKKSTILQILFQELKDILNSHTYTQCDSRNWRGKS